ncbi:MAG TPA: class I SAM-dependent methyltransferase [Casimicrobiaceae bacterium]|nr:class I SAM-dependent methyltransferase [Casimicrobiaceae bacterium]
MRTTVRQADWPLRLRDASSARVAALRTEVEAIGQQAQYGWGHTIDFGPFVKEGLLGDAYLSIVGTLDALGWWPQRLHSLDVADIGCYTGGIAVILASRGARTVYAVDELPPHVDQCRLLARVFDLRNIECITATVYGLERHIAPRSLDIVFCAGVLYHLSDMLVGLYDMNRLLKPSATLLIETNAVEDFDASYANYGRFYAGMWWQPSALCVIDMLKATGFADIDVRFIDASRCIVRATKVTEDLDFRRGMNRAFDSMADRKPRLVDPALMAPARR